MKGILPLVITSLLFSCSTFQYVTVSSDQLGSNDTGDFVMENDTLKVTYKFTGYHGPVKITIYNKTDQSLEINWKKSVVIMNEKASSYYDPKLFLAGDIRTDTSAGLYSSIAYRSDISADIYVNEPSQYVPPKASISKTPLRLPVRYFGNLTAAEQKKKVYRFDAYHVFKYRETAYPKENSPVNFRSFLVFNYGGDADREFALDHRFYISQIRESASSPQFLPKEVTEKGNVFYLTD